jgi:uncharacterized protein YecE (DUF72 family)
MIRVGIGGWTYAPWRGVFYPPGLAQARELEYAGKHLTSIEINGTFYGSQKPESFRRWATETPDDFVFSVKGPRFATHRKVLAEAGESIERFFNGGVRELGRKLGPVLWQFAPFKKFEPDDFGAFLALLPKDVRHAVEVRHDSFLAPEFTALARKHKVAIVLVESDKHPPIDATTADFTYARLQKTKKDIATGYAKADLRMWAQQARKWEAQGKRDVFVYMISGAKERAPAAAMALIEELGSK